MMKRRFILLYGFSAGCPGINTIHVTCFCQNKCTWMGRHNLNRIAVENHRIIIACCSKTILIPLPARLRVALHKSTDDTPGNSAQCRLHHCSTNHFAQYEPGAEVCDATSDAIKYISPWNNLLWYLWKMCRLHTWTCCISVWFALSALIQGAVQCYVFQPSVMIMYWCCKRVLIR